MSLVYIKNLDLKTQKTKIRAQKIHCFTLEISGMVIADFQIENLVDRSRFFQKTFLVANTKFELILDMPFIKISNIDISFGQKILI